MIRCRVDIAGQPFVTTSIFGNQVPIGVNEATPHHHVSKLGLDLGLFAQDRTIKSVTLNLGVRFDGLHDYNPAQCRPAGFHARVLFRPGGQRSLWRDISERLSYDVFGNGKTAVKVMVSRYAVLGHGYRQPDQPGRCHRRYDADLDAPGACTLHATCATPT
jgi:hypothetical protein